MAYCTYGDLSEALPSQNLIEITDDEGRDSVALPRITRAIEDADALIDSYTRGTYAIPFDPVPGIIRQISVDLALYKLYSRRFELEMPDAMRARYTDALELLRRIERRDMLLDSPLAQHAGNAPAVIVTNRQRRLFSDDLLRRMP